MKGTKKVNPNFYEPNMKTVEENALKGGGEDDKTITPNTSKSTPERLDKMESLMLEGINKMEEIDRKLDEILDKNNNKNSEELT